MSLTSISFAQSVDTFVPEESSNIHEENFHQIPKSKNKFTLVLMFFSTMSTILCFFMILYSNSGSGGFRNLYKKINK